MKVTIAGGGIIGLTCAWRLHTAGHDVTVHDPAPASGASWAAAGMIAPAGEAWFGEEPLLRLGIASAALWPEYAAGIGVELHRSGTVLAGRDAGDLAVLRRTVQLLESLAVAVHTGSDLASDPALSDRVLAAALLPDDAHINPREVLTALLRELGDRVVHSPLPDHVTERVVRCTGAAAHPALHRVRGEILRVRSPDGPQRMIRGLVHGESVYLVPRPGGELVVGATSEAQAGPPVVTVGGVLRLLGAARALVPSLERAEVLEVLARDRPATPDNGPLIGAIGEQTFLAAGHHRSGVLLAPLTAEAVLAWVEDRPPPPGLDAFAPARFNHWKAH